MLLRSTKYEGRRTGFFEFVLCTSFLVLFLSSGYLGKTHAKPAKKAETERVKIYSDKAIYKREDKLARAIGHVRIIQEETTIYADEAVYYEDTKHSFIEDGVKVVQISKKKKNRQTVITADKMTAFHEEKRIFFEKDVRMDRGPDLTEPPPKDYTEDKEEKRKRVEASLKKERSVITADDMEYFTKSENANLRGNVVVLQKEKKITGDKAFVKGEADGDVIIIEGNAHVTQIRGNWLVREKIIKPDPEDEEQQRFLTEKLVMTADKIILYKATDDMDALDNVKITQTVGAKERVAVGDKAFYRDKQQAATLTGNVKIQRENGDWLTADQAIFYTEKEDFEAIGTQQDQVISEFTMDEEDERASKEPINPPLPEFDLDKHQPGPVLPSWLRGGAPKPTPKPREPSPAPTPSPKPRTGESSPAPTPTPKPRTGESSPAPTPKPTPVESSFTIETE